MQTKPDSTPFIAGMMRAAALVSSVLVVGLGICGLLGWWLNIDALKSVLPGLATMKPNTAVCFVLSGLALLALQQGRRRIAVGLGLATFGIAALTLSQYVFGWQLGLDQLLFRDLATPANQFPGRMSLSTATCFTLLGIALLMVQMRRFALAQSTALIVAVIALIAVIGYLYETTSLYRVLFYSSIAVHTALGLLTLAGGLLASTAFSGWMAVINAPTLGGRLMRQLLPGAVLIPVGLGWLIILGENVGLIDSVMTFELLVFSSILLFTALVVSGAQMIQRSDLERQRAEQALRRQNRAYRTLSECNQTLIRATEEHNLLEQICQHITEAGGYLACWIGLNDDAENVITHSENSRLREGGMPAPQAACAAPLTRKAILTGEPHIAHYQQERPPDAACEAEMRALGYASVIALPMLHQQLPLGVLVVYSEDVEGFADDEVVLLKELASDLAFGIQTIRQRAAHAAAEARVHYQASLLENVSDAVIATNAEGRITNWNKAAEFIYGWTEQETLGKTVRELLNTQFLADTMENANSVIRKTGVWRGEVLQTQKQGGKVDILSSVALLKDPAGVMIGMVAVNRDLTHIKLAARVAEISEQKFRTIFEQTPDVVAVVNSSEWVVQSINAAVEQQLGYAPETLIGKPFSTLFPPDAGSPDLLLERTTTYGAVFADQPFMRRDGTLCDMDLTATMIPWDDNQAVLVTLRDVSERKRLERELLKAELERVSLEKDREVLELKEAFIATVSHDFRSPLASISMATEMLTEYRDRLTPERTLDHLGSIRQQASYMLRLLDDVLYFNKTKAGKLDFEPSTIDLVSYGQVLFEQLRQEASPAHSFVYNAAGELREAYMDEKILQRVLSNLIGNAIKYSPEGGEIRFQITREDDDVLFEISDQGIGIPPEDQAKIFEPFSRARNARKIKGTGLGMAIVYDNIKLHGGDVWLRSAEGQGTTFTVRLPYRVNAPKV